MSERSIRPTSMGLHHIYTKESNGMRTPTPPHPPPVWREVERRELREKLLLIAFRELVKHEHGSEQWYIARVEDFIDAALPKLPKDGRDATG